MTTLAVHKPCQSATAWLIQTDTHTILVDTGYIEDYQAFVEGMDDLNIDLQSIDTIFLTHAHDDHAGFINNVLAETTATLIMDEKALSGMYRGQNGPGGGAAGQAALQACFDMAKQGRGAHRFPPLAPENEARCMLVDETNRADIGQTLGATIVPLPGHTDDSIGLLMDGQLFCGDAVMESAPDGNDITIWIGNLPQYIQSWQTIIDLAPKAIYPGHGEAVTIAQLNEHMDELKELVLLDMKGRPIKG